MQCLVGRFNIGTIIGSGSYGTVYNGKDLSTGDLVAIKKEKVAEKAMKSSIDMESEVYVLLKGETGIPNLRWKGKIGGLRVIVLDLLGDNLDYLLCYRCNGIFSLKTVSVIADQMLLRLEALHKCGYIHRDLKPDNIVMGRGQAAHTVHLIDFGVAAKLPCPGGYCGYLPFASIRMHHRNSLTPRDDLESLGYILILLLTGTLPWARFKGAAHQRSILKSKLTALDNVLKHLPNSFALYMNYVKSDSRELPNYAYLRSLFAQLASSPGKVQNDHVFDWQLPGGLVDKRVAGLYPIPAHFLQKAVPVGLRGTPALGVEPEQSNFPPHPMKKLLAPLPPQEQQRMLKQSSPRLGIAQDFFRKKSKYHVSGRVIVAPLQPRASCLPVPEVPNVLSRPPNLRVSGRAVTVGSIPWQFHSHDDQHAQRPVATATIDDAIHTAAHCRGETALVGRGGGGKGGGDSACDDSGGGGDRDSANGRFCSANRPHSRHLYMARSRSAGVLARATALSRAAQRDRPRSPIPDS